MAIDLPIPSGPTNKEIIDRAYQALGLSDSMFGRNEEEYASAMLTLGGMMYEWPFSAIGFIAEDAAGLRVEEESGISREYLEAVGLALAERLAPLVGKSLSKEANRLKATAYSRLCSKVSVLPDTAYGDATAAGSGHRFYGRTYFAKAG